MKKQHTEEEREKIKSLGLKPQEVTPEKEFRERLLNYARNMGCEYDVARILNRYDKLLERISNPTEREQLAVMALGELHKYFNFHDGLTVNRKVIIPADSDSIINKDSK